MSDESDIDLSEWEQASFKKMLSFSFGYLLVFFFITQFNTYVFYYYEVEIGLPVMLLGLAFVIFAIWNMINDPLLGYLTDRPFKFTKKWGMRFPWMVIGIIPFLFCYFLLFAIPDNLVENPDPWGVFLYFVIVSCALDTFYSLFVIHINASFTTHFRTDAERRKSSVVNTTIPQLIAILIGFIVPIFYIYGNRDTMVFAQMLVVLVLFICMIITIPGIRESEDLKERFLKGYENTEREPYWVAVKSVFRQRNFVVALLIFMLFTFANVLANASRVYFFKDILKLPYSVSIYTVLAGYIGFLLFIPFWANRCKKMGQGKTMRLAFLLIALSYLPGLWITTLEEAIIFGFIGGAVVGGFWIPLGLVSSDVYDEVTVTTGKHQEAMYQGIRTFFDRLSLIFVGIAIPVVHIHTGYNPDTNAVQTPLAIWGIRVHRSLMPALICLIAFIIMTKWYNLYGKKLIAVKKKLIEMGL